MDSFFLKGGKQQGETLKQGTTLKVSPFCFALFFFTLGIPAFAYAQQVTTIGTMPPPVQYTLTPTVPGPNQQVNIQVEGVGNFLGNSPVTWTVNGVTAQSGTGSNSFNFTTGPLGHPTTVTVTINSTQNGTITNTWNFNPSLVNLVWEAQTTVPPFYGGKALYSTGSGLTVFAFPEVIQNGSRVPDSKLSFQWQLNNQPQVDSSGLGRDRFSFQGDQLLTEEDPSVDIMLGNTTVAHADITIPTTQPQLIFYARDPLRGVLYDTALPSTYTMNGAEITVHAEPYYFSQASVKNGLQWSWTLNNSPTSGPNSNQGELTLRTQGGGAGSAILGVSLQNTSALSFLQAAQNSINLMFGSQQQNLIFGL